MRARKCSGPYAIRGEEGGFLLLCVRAEQDTLQEVAESRPFPLRGSRATTVSKDKIVNGLELRPEDSNRSVE